MLVGRQLLQMQYCFLRKLWCVLLLRGIQVVSRICGTSAFECAMLGDRRARAQTCPKGDTIAPLHEKVPLQIGFRTSAYLNPLPLLRGGLAFVPRYLSILAAIANHHQA
mgnify:CR=1 FL=1